MPQEERIIDVPFKIFEALAEEYGKGEERRTFGTRDIIFRTHQLTQLTIGQHSPTVVFLSAKVPDETKLWSQVSLYVGEFRQEEKLAVIGWVFAINATRHTFDGGTKYQQRCIPLIQLGNYHLMSLNGNDSVGFLASKMLASAVELSQQFPLEGKVV